MLLSYAALGLTPFATDTSRELFCLVFLLACCEDSSIASKEFSFLPGSVSSPVTPEAHLYSAVVWYIDALSPLYAYVL